MPSTYDLYAALGLDRSQSPEQLAAELDYRMEGVTRETPQWNELSAARAVLGDPTRRQMYDQRLGDPSQTVTPAEIQQLAAMNVGAASGSARGGFLGRAWRESPKMTATAGVLAVAVLVVGGLAIGGAVGGGDDDTSNTSASGSSASAGSESDGSVEDIDPDSIMAEDQREFANMRFLNPGETVEFGEGKKYEYDDGHTEVTFPDGYKYQYTVDNVRKFEHTESGDPDAPADHPDAQGETATYACVDVNGTMIQDMEKAAQDSNASAPGNYSTDATTLTENMIREDFAPYNSHGVLYIASNGENKPPWINSNHAFLPETFMPGVKSYDDILKTSEWGEESIKGDGPQVNGKNFALSKCLVVKDTLIGNERMTGDIVVPLFNNATNNDTDAVGWRFTLGL